MHISLLMANTDESEFARARPRDGEKWAQLLAEVRPGWRLSVHAVKDGEFPDGIEGVDGWIISGSPASVNDPDPWVAQLGGLIRQIVAAGQPLFGACFGHQAIAVALGGQVGRNPGPFVLGPVTTQDHTAARGLTLFAAHGEQVLRLPDGARVLASNDACPVGAFAVGDRVLTTQYHPEITPEFMSDLIDELQGKLPQDVLDRARAAMGVSIDRAVMAERIAAFMAAG